MLRQPRSGANRKDRTALRGIWAVGLTCAVVLTPPLGEAKDRLPAVAASGITAGTSAGLLRGAQPPAQPVGAPQTARDSSSTRSNGLRGMQDLTANKSGLTQLLSATDIDLYRRIFALQDKGQWPAADRLIKQVSNDILVGHVLAQRYLHPDAYHSQYGELRNWLNVYADLPEARRIYALAAKRRPSGASWPAKPQGTALRYGPVSTTAPLVPKRRNATERRRVANIQRTVKRYLSKEMPTKALSYLESGSVSGQLTRLEADDLRASIAASYFYEHVDDKALRLAGKVAERNAARVPLADWTAGLAAYRLNKPELASHHFERLARSPGASTSMRAAGGYWAARTYLVSGTPERVTANLTLAAKAPTTFYGLLALRQLGLEPPLNWQAPNPSERDLAEALSLPGVRRAVALAQVGHAADADEELRRAHGAAPDRLDEALLKIAADHKLAAAELHIAEAVPGRPFHASLYPIPAYQPRDGYNVDPAILYALMRQESRFKPEAKSWAGARGLMQIMPATAAYVAKDRSLNWDRTRLFDPGFNMTLGQNYVDQLLGQVEPKGNLFMMAVAYNGGPTNLKRWYREMAVQDDPLLFIESIPVTESRNYVEHVLTNLWLYRYRMGEHPASLDMVAGGDWPIYISQTNYAGRHIEAIPAAQSGR